MKLSFLLLPLLVLPAAAQLRITEVMSDSAHSDADASGDWFEITNTGTTAVNISNYSFDDDSATAGTSGGFPAFSLAPDASLIVLNEADSTNFRTLWNIPTPVRIITNSELSAYPGLSSNGDAVFLYNNGGAQIDTFPFSIATEGFTFTRFTNGSSVPGGLSTADLFGAYESDDPSEDVGSPGVAQGLPDPLSPIFSAPFKTAGLAGSNLSVSEFLVRSFDPNPGDTITLTATGTPTWLTVTDNGDGTASLSGTPPVSAIGPHEFEITATDNTNRSANQTYRIDILPTSSPIILNEYNAVAIDEFLDGGGETDAGAPSDPNLGRIVGNGGAWVEFVVTQTTDFRGWTLTIESESQTRTIKLSDHIALSNIAAGTILTFTENQATSPTFLNRISALNSAGLAWSNIWMHDIALIDQNNSTHPSSPAIGSDDTLVTWSDSTDQIIYGPSGESIAINDSDSNGIGDALISVGGTELLKLERNPTSTATPLDLNYDDGSTSTFGAANIWADGTMTQSFAAFFSATTPPAFGPVSQTQAVRGDYSVTINAPTATITVLEAPDFLSINTAGGQTVITNNRPLTFADIGTYEVTIQADNGAASNNLGYLVYQLEVLNPAPALILNEYNAVAPDNFLNGGIAALDEDGAPASADSHFGRIVGNGGNWFELALVGDGTPGFTDLSGWFIEVGEIANSGQFVPANIIVLSDADSWSAIANGTLLTFIDQDTAGGGLDTEFNRTNLLASEGFAWSNIYLGDTELVTVTNLATLDINSSNTAFLIKDASGNVIFGPSGEGIAPLSGVGGSEIFELENDASTLVSSVDISSDTFLGYDDGSSGSTFGSPNLFAPLGSLTDRAQDFAPYILSPLQLYFAEIGIPGADPAADADNDGFSNLEEYLLGGDPIDVAIFPTTGINPNTGTISVTVRTNDPNFVLTPERSPNLVDWFTDQLDTTDEPSPLGADFVIRNFVYDGNEPRMFFRVTTQP